VDKEKKAEWKKILDALSEENYRIEEAWQDLAEHEAIVNRKLETGDFSSDEERIDCENDRDQLAQARALLKVGVCVSDLLKYKPTFFYLAKGKICMEIDKGMGHVSVGCLKVAEHC
jgi:hypothetical protein